MIKLDFQKGFDKNPLDWFKDNKDWKYYNPRV